MTQQILKAICFAAVSDPSQLKNDSIERQKADGQAVITQRGWREVHAPLEVPGISRNWDFLADAEREVPAIAELLRLSREGLLDVVVVRRYNRLARTNALLQQISAYLHRHKVQIYAWEEPVEVLPPDQLGRRRDTARLMIEGVSGLLAEADNTHRTQRNQDGMLTRIKRGGHPAGMAPYGYHDIIAEDGVGRSHHKRVTEPVEYPVLCEVLRLLKEGYSAVWIERLLAGELDGRTPTKGRRGARLSRQVILHWAQQPYYYGKTFRGWYPLDAHGHHAHQRKEPLVLIDSDHECPCTWEERAIILRNIAERDTVGPRRKSGHRPWGGIARCGYCLDAGRVGTMRYRLDIQKEPDGRQRQYEYLYCMHYSNTGGRGCQRNGIKLSEFLALLFRQLSNAAAQPELRAAFNSTPDARPDETARLQRELEALAGAEQRWDEAYAAGAIDLAKYGERLEETRRRRAELAERLRTEQRLLEAGGEVRRQRERALDSFGEALARGDPFEQARLVRQIVECVILRDSELTICWR